MCPYAQSLAIIIEVKPAILLEADRVELGIDSVFVTDHIKKTKKHYCLNLVTGEVWLCTIILLYL